MKSEEESSMSQLHHQSSSTSTTTASTAVLATNQKVLTCPSAPHWRRPNLFLEIPERTIDEPPEEFVRINMPPTPISTPTRARLPPPSPILSSRRNNNSSPYPSSRGKSMKNFLPKVSFKHKDSTLDTEKASMLAIGTPVAGPQEKTSIIRSVSLTKLFTPRIKRTSSLPVTPIAHSNPNSVRGVSVADTPNSTKNVFQHHMARSLSVPDKARTIRRMDSLGGVFRVIPTTPRVTESSCTTSNMPPTPHTGILLLIDPLIGAYIRHFFEKSSQDVPILVIVSMLGYFCFLEQLLVGKMGTGAIAISLPFACIFWSSCINDIINHGKYIWVLASVEFVMVVFFTHILHSLVINDISSNQNNMCCFSFSFLEYGFHSFMCNLFCQSYFPHSRGFGLAMSGSSIFVEILRWRRRWLVWSINRRQTQQGTTSGSDQQPEQEQPTQRTHSNKHNEAGIANTVLFDEVMYRKCVIPISIFTV
ncbi:hypothetical protein MKX03_009739 [Papaver bracteatum]|nr:hypothetical protein MKX03_009739 [Papaver bracteatum]